MYLPSSYHSLILRELHEDAINFCRTWLLSRRSWLDIIRDHIQFAGFPYGEFKSVKTCEAISTICFWRSFYEYSDSISFQFKSEWICCFVGHTAIQFLSSRWLNPSLLRFFLQILVDVLTKESIVCKLKMLKTASSFVNSRLHAVKAQTLVLAR